MNVKELEELVLSLQKKLDRATAEISRLKAENAMLKEKLAKYESKRRNNSKNTSQPPSQDQKSEPAEKETVENNGKPVNQYNDQQPSNRSVGGQKGHKGKTLSKEEVQTLIEANMVSHNIVYHGYAKNPEDYIIRYELAVDVSTKVIEHRFASIYLVPEQYHSDVVYDASVKGIAAMLHAGHHVALDRVSSILSYLTKGIH